jgi:hypothetical protein
MTTCELCHRYATWARWPGEPWRRIGSGDTYAESEAAADKWLRDHGDELPRVETFTAVCGSALPCVGSD